MPCWLRPAMRIASLIEALVPEALPLADRVLRYTGGGGAALGRFDLVGSIRRLLPQKDGAQWVVATIWVAAAHGVTCRLWIAAAHEIAATHSIAAARGIAARRYAAAMGGSAAQWDRRRACHGRACVIAAAHGVARHPRGRRSWDHRRPGDRRRLWGVVAADAPPVGSPPPID